MQKQWTTKDTNGQKANWLVIDDLGPSVHWDGSGVVLRWAKDWTIEGVMKVLQGVNPDCAMVHVLNGTGSVLLPHILAESVNPRTHIYFFQDNTEFSREERFEIATFLGQQATGKSGNHANLRSVYNLWSHQVMWNPWGLSDLQKNRLEGEIPMAQLNADCLGQDWVRSLMSLLENGEAPAVEFPNEKVKIDGSVLNKLKPALRAVKRKLKGGDTAGAPREAKVGEYELVRPKDPRQWNKVLITGWYGTETAGDKAILGEIIHQLRSYNSELEIFISSIDLRVSWQTRIEMDIDVHHVPIKTMHSLLNDDTLDAVVFGGGPLMESSQITPIEQFYAAAAKKGVNCVVFGCGVGPIHTDDMTLKIGNIIKYSNVAFYRDQESLDYALRLGGNPERSRLACDPATAFVFRYGNSKAHQKVAGKVSTMLREQTSEYDTGSGVKDLNAQFPKKVASTLSLLAEQKDNPVIDLIPMHAYWRGNDDRLLNRKISNALDPRLTQYPVYKYRGIYELLDDLAQSNLALAMRFHGHIFSIALHIPFISLDYTGKKGKVSNLMGRTNLDAYSIKFKESSVEQMKSVLNQLMAEEGLPDRLKEKSEELMGYLNSAYKYFWN